jgi:hypothetical protein
MDIHFACNDEHGNFMGRAERIQIGDLSLECTLMYSGVKLETEAGQLLRVGRILVPFSGYRYGVGNWCWDGYRIADEDVLKIIHYLQKQKYWTCHEGPCDQYEKFNAKQSFTVEDLKAVV